MQTIISHTLAPSRNSMPSKVKNEFTEVKQINSEEIERILACNNLLDYSGFNK